MKKLAYAALPIGLALLVVAAGWGFLAPRLLPAAARVIMALGLIFSLFGLWGRRSALREPAGGRRIRAGANAVASIGVLALLVLFANFFSARHHERWDLTRYRSYSLHPVTERIVKAIDKDVDVYGFFSQANQRTTTQKLFDVFHLENSRIKVIVDDPNRRPDLVKQFGLPGTNLTLVVAGDRKVIFPGADEADLAKALVEVSRNTNKAIYWLIGHGERTLEAPGGVGFQRLRVELSREYYAMQPLALGPTDQVPQDASLVIVADPHKPLSETEVAALDAYLRRGGRMLVLQDVDYTATPDTLRGADALLDRWGLLAEPAVVYDPRSRTGEADPRIVVGEFFGQDPHESVAALVGNRVVLPLVRPLSFRRVMSDQQIFHHVLLMPGQQGVLPGAGTNPYVEPDLGKAQSADIDRAVQVNWIDQPISLAIAAFRKFEPAPGRPEAGREARLILVGDADFMTDAAWDREANGEFALNLVRWATGEELLIRREGERRQAREVMALEPDQLSTMMMAVLVAPLVVALFGAVMWFVRRSR